MLDFEQIAESEEIVMERLHNYVLYVDHFSDDFQDDRLHKICQPKDINDVFNHYKPCKRQIELVTEDGDIVYEHFEFLDISDFDDDQLIAHSEILSILYRRMNDSAVAYQCLKDNLYIIHEETRTLEITYRTLELLIGASSEDIFLINVNKENLCDNNSYDTQVINKMLEGCYKPYDGEGLPSILAIPVYLVIPGYLGDNNTVRMWAKSAYRNRVVLITDFMDCSDFDKLILELNEAHLLGQENYLANVVMTCNYVAAKLMKSVVDEERKLYVPASAALTARMLRIMHDIQLESPVYDNRGIRISLLEKQNIVDIESALYEKLYDTDVRIDLNGTQSQEIRNIGLVPIVKQKNKSAKSIGITFIRTLYNGGGDVLWEFLTTFALSQIENPIRDVLNRLYWWARSKRSNDIQSKKNQLMWIIDRYLSLIQNNLIQEYEIKQVETCRYQYDYKEIFVDLEIRILSKTIMLEIRRDNIIEKYIAHINKYEM